MENDWDQDDFKSDKNCYCYSGGFISAILLFICFWLVGGWERVDCALGVKTACAKVELYNGNKN